MSHIISIEPTEHDLRFVMVLYDTRTKLKNTHTHTCF